MYMSVKFSSGDLNSDLCTPHSTSTYIYTYRMTIAQKIYKKYVLILK